MTTALTKVSDLIRLESGIVLGPAQHGALELAIARVDKGMTPVRLLAVGSGDVLQRLIDEVTVRETFFFRHRNELEAIDWHRALRSARRRGSDVVQVWVAGCASGEEAYTVAALACEAYASAAPPVHIVASDIALPALEQARRGFYRRRASRLLPERIRTRYFTSDGGRVEVGPSLRALVEVVQHNLVQASVSPCGSAVFDLILCRNVLIYFDPPTVERVLGLLERSLATDGMLLLGAADRLCRQAGLSAAASPATGARPRSARRPPGPPRSGPPAPVPAAVLRPVVSAGGRGLGGALEAADRGDLAMALEITRAALAQEPCSAEAYYVRGITELASGDSRAAIASLRRALYFDPTMIAAAFKLARAHDDVGEAEAARSAYERTLRTIDHADAASSAVMDSADVGDLAVACHARLSVLASDRSRSRSRSRP